MKMLKWWAMRQIPKDEEALILEKPELPEEPETSKETEAKTSPVSVGGKSLGLWEPRWPTSQAAAPPRPPGALLQNKGLPGTPGPSNPEPQGWNPEGISLGRALQLIPMHDPQHREPGLGLSLCTVLQTELPFQQPSPRPRPCSTE